jgi:hypothetical protein
VGAKCCPKSWYVCAGPHGFTNRQNNSDIFSAVRTSLSCKYWRMCVIQRHVKWVPCHHGMARPQVADGADGLQMWRVAAIVLNKQSRTADWGWSCSLGVGRGANNPPT